MSLQRFVDRTGMAPTEALGAGAAGASKSYSD